MGIRIICIMICVGATGMLAGCQKAERPQMGYVSGIVTLNGTPLERVSIVFRPIEGGRQSSGLTDSSGHYDLKYLEEEKGASVGMHEVYLSTYLSEDAPGGPLTEWVPAAYRGRGKLKREVQPGKNQINFELTDEIKSSNSSQNKR